MTLLCRKYFPKELIAANQAKLPHGLSEMDDEEEEEEEEEEQEDDE